MDRIELAARMAEIEEDMLRRRSPGATFLPFGDGLARIVPGYDSPFPSANPNRVISIGVSASTSPPPQGGGGEERAGGGVPSSMQPRPLSSHHSDVPLPKEGEFLALLQHIDVAFTEAGIGTYFHYVSPSRVENEYRTALEQSRWEIQAELSVLARPVAPVEPHIYDIRALSATDRSGDELVDKNIAEALHYASSEGVVFGALLDDRVVGTGLVKRYGNIGYFSHGVTAAPFRKRGVQSALIAHRLNWCAEHGIEWAVSETYAFLPSSYDNLMRARFEEIYARPIYTKLRVR